MSALLGEPAERATWAGVRRLVANKTPEHFDLDFKRDLYEDPEKNNAPASEKKYALPDDVAAMANSGGGIIVLGVDAPQPEGVAQSETPVVLSDATEQRFRQRVASHVFPMVQWETHRVPLDGETAKGFYLLLVPPSAIAPHAVSRDSGLRYLVRDQHTNRALSEAEVARRYRHRFELGVSRRDRMTEVLRNGRQLWGSPRKAYVEVGIVPFVEGELPLTRATYSDLEERVKVRASRNGDVLSPHYLDVSTYVRHRHLRAFAGSANSGLTYVLDYHSDGSVYWARHLLSMSQAFRSGPREMVREEAICVALGQPLFEFPQWVMSRGRLSGDAILRVRVAHGGQPLTLGRAGDPHLAVMQEPLPALSEDVEIDEVVNLDSLIDQAERGRLILRLLTEVVQAFGKVAPESVVERHDGPYWEGAQQALKLMGFGASS